LRCSTTTPRLAGVSSIIKIRGVGEAAEMLMKFVSDLWFLVTGNWKIQLSDHCITKPRQMSQMLVNARSSYRGSKHLLPLTSSRLLHGWEPDFVECRQGGRLHLSALSLPMAMRPFTSGSRVGRRALFSRPGPVSR
jgi:hypothetical protein